LRWRKEHSNDWISAHSKVLATRRSSGNRLQNQYIARRRKLTKSSTERDVSIGQTISTQDDNQLMFRFAASDAGITSAQAEAQKLVLEVLVVGKPRLRWIRVNHKNISLVRDLVRGGSESGGEEEPLFVCRHYCTKTKALVPGKVS